MTPGDFLPEWTSIPIGGGLYRPAYRLFVGQPLRMVPNTVPLPCPIRATAAAKRYVVRKINPPIRAATAAPDPDPLGLSSWLEDRAGEADRRQEQAFGTIFRNGRAIPVKKRNSKRFA